MSTHRPLHDGWTLSAVSEDVRITGVPAAVPGCVHTDLLAAGLIEDPYLDDNESRLGWIGRTDWLYRTEFTWTGDEHEHTDLVCAGLDTVATITLNGVKVGGTANQHRSYRFPVRHLLAEGVNTLEVRFASPYGYAEARRAELGERPGAYAEPYQFIRKMACNFGWDWGPTLVTSGIWQPIGLESWSGARLAQVRPLVHGDGRVEVHVVVAGAGTVTAEVAGVTVSAEVAGEGVLRLQVPEPRLWWPRGYGEPYRYDLTVRLGEQVEHRRIGFRDVRLDQTGGAFTIVVNGTPVAVRGVNWIPDDCFPSRLTRERLATRLSQATEANVNLVRVWGGGRYESDDFYDLTDELGLLVWQDFPFACAAYPEEEPFASEVEAEAREQVARLSARPSLVLWCGNNENIEGHADWGWKETLGERSWGAGFYFDLLPKVVAELDPTRPYWPGSPYSGAPDLPPNDPARGTIHIWDVWNREDYTRYAAYRPRFVAEFGFQGPPTHATLREGSSQEPPVGHQKAVDGEQKLLRGLGEHLPQPRDFDDWHYLTQVNQARAVAFGIEHFRAQLPACTGTIVWQLNDCWPVVSWAAVDGGGRRKPLWYALRRVYADRLLTVREGEVVVVNDSPEVWSGELEQRRLTVGGETLAEGRVAVEVPARSTAVVPLLDGPDAGLVAITLGEHRRLHFLAEDPQAGLPVAAYDTRVTAEPGGVAVTVTARTLLRELALFPDRLDPAATVDEQLVTLLPGESVTFHVATERELDPAALIGHPVLRCVNEARP
ncbi:glycoside hydrolase family 2 protein [Nonomuraea sp. NPDC050310]|uniref:glycoside hydrolase family 2 protein n=1 Tax=Nonomuraea sp. NPDC050310 TaxID=3154935 RepID=UPI0033F4622D